MDSFPTTVEAPRKSLELLFKVSREFSTGADLNAVLNSVLSLCIEHVKAISGSIVVLDDHKQPIETAFMMPGYDIDHRYPQLYLTYEYGLAGWVARKLTPVLIEDTRQDRRWLQRPDDAEECTGSKSALSVPVMVHEQIIGVITLVHSIPGFFREEHLHLVQTIAEQTGMAILNARLILEYKHHLMLEDAWAECAVSISESKSQDDLLRTIVRKISRALKTERVSLCLLDQESGDLIFRVVNSPAQKSLVGKHISAGKGIIGWVLKSESGLIVPDISLDARYQPDVNLDMDLSQKSQALICSMIRSQGEILGVIIASATAPATFDQQHLRLLEGVGAMIGLVIRQTHFYEESPTSRENYREDLIEMVYHDLRSPLSNVVSSLEALNGLVRGDETVDSLLKIALRSTQHAQRLTTSLLDINRLEAGQKFGQRDWVNIESLLDYSISAVHFLTSEKHVYLSKESNVESISIWVDEDMIRRVIINLLENAVKFTPSKGKIWVGAKRMNDVILFWVRDFGPGISPANQEKIFKKFVRLQPQKKARGLGLGLAYCQLAVRAHGGEIWVESQPGEGACFKFTLPITSKEPSDVDAPPGGAATLED